MPGRAKKPRQQTLDAVFGQSQAKAAKKKSADMEKPSSPVVQSSPVFSSSFMTKSKARVVVIDSSDSAGEGGAAAGDDSDDSDRPLVRRHELQRQKEDEYNSSPPVSQTTKVTSSQSHTLGRDDDDDDDDDDDLPIVTPAQKRRLGRAERTLVSDTSDDDDDEPVISSPLKRRRLVNALDKKSRGSSNAVDSASGSPRSPRSSEQASKRRLGSSKIRSSRVTPRNKKSKAMELLRRKRAGETIEEDDLDFPSEEDVKGVYDTDSEYGALEVFDDDEEGVLEYKEPVSGKSNARKGKSAKSSKETRLSRGDSEINNDDSDSIDEFVVEDDDAPIGAPALDIPLEFTAHAHKPLREHFKNVVEWLIQRRINPGFSDRNSPLYRMAWKKLNDMVSGLAQSKFSSSAWKPEFTMALRARPEMSCEEIPKADLSELQGCDACGRSNHPATWVVTFIGSAYVKNSMADNFLDPVESDSDQDSPDTDNHDGEDDDRDMDEDGNYIPKETKCWYVGVVCKGNAENAHTLMHWKHSLQDWVEGSLAAQGYLNADKLAERERLTPKKRVRLVDKIRDEWERRGNLDALYNDFKRSIDEARTRSTTGKGRR